MKVALVAFVTFLAVPLVSYADAVLYVSPERGNYTVGQTFQVQVFADSGGSLINAAEADISFNTEALEVLDVSTNGSILESWSSGPEFSNEEGTVHFAGWTRNNFNGVNGLLVTVTFKAERNMIGTARLAAGAILAADGRESNIISSMRSGAFTIAPKEQMSAAGETAIGSDMSSTSAIQAKLPAPVFEEYPNTVAIGEHIIIKGNAEPNSTIDVFLSRGNEREEKTQLLSAADGSFTFVSDSKVIEGLYHVYAMIETSDGRIGLPSETIDIRATQTGMAATALFGASLIFELLPFFAILVFGSIAAGYIYHRHQLAKMHYGGHLPHQHH